MLDRFHFIFFFLFLIQCAGPQTAVLGPVLTGAKTGSIYQTSLSYGSNRIMDELEAEGVISEYVGEKKSRTVL